MQARQVKVDGLFLVFDHFLPVGNLISYFIESVIHLYLYERNVYPRASFTDFVAFGLHLKVIYCNFL
uniref:HORMA domain-containing protein n=1 Tax=Schistosoma curassoni TaxID=6186 RepID=A0A183JEF9_9TREM